LPAHADPETRGLTSGTFGGNHSATSGNGGRVEAGPRTFWQDLAGAFVLFLEGGNLAALGVLTVVSLLVSLLAAFAGLFPLWGLLLWLLFYAYLAVFSYAIILQFASGEDSLPIVGAEGRWDFVAPMLGMVGSALYVALPAGLYALGTWWYAGTVDSGTAYILLAVGSVFWPAVILMVAIGDGLRGLWPHTVLLTIAAAPIRYAAVCGALAVVAAIGSLLDVMGPVSLGGALLRTIAGHALSMYALIVSMCVIGLYYRHCKHRFPWAAE